MSGRVVTALSVAFMFTHVHGVQRMRNWFRIEFGVSTLISLNLGYFSKCSHPNC